MLFAALMTACNMQLAAQAGGAADTVPERDNVMIGEVVVTGARNATDVRHLSQTVSVVDRATLERACSRRCCPCLPNRCPDCL